VAWVNSGLKSSKYYDLAKEYLPKGQNGIVTFGLKGGFEAAKTVADETKYFSKHRRYKITDYSSGEYNTSTTISRRTGCDRVTKDLIRLSVGIEDIDD
jgi:O-acetylhomoserine (thiol)-lyase